MTVQQPPGLRKTLFTTAKTASKSVVKSTLKKWFLANALLPLICGLIVLGLMIALFVWIGTKGEAKKARDESGPQMQAVLNVTAGVARRIEGMKNFGSGDHGGAARDPALSIGEVVRVEIGLVLGLVLGVLGALRVF